MHLPKHKIVAIVAFCSDIRNADAMAEMAERQPVPIPRVIHYQVTIDPSRVSPTSEYIRFGPAGDGLGQGDEITGWIGVRELEIIETLAHEDESGALRSNLPQSKAA